MEYTVINILDLLETVGEEEIGSILSDFSCPQNPEIENFLHNNAVEFAKKKMSMHARFEETAQAYSVSAYLIAQFGKNYGWKEGKAISGDQLMDLAFDVLERVQHQIGGGLVFLECEEHEALLKFYQNEHNRFRIFGERYSERDQVKYLKLLRFF